MMQPAKEGIIETVELKFDRKADNTLLVRLKGSWTIDQKLPAVEEVQRQVKSDTAVKQIAFDTRELSDWDSGLVSFLTKIINQYADKNITVDQEGLPEGVRKLLHLAFAVPERKGARREASREPWLTRVGAATIGAGQSSVETLNFIGEAFLAFWGSLSGFFKIFCRQSPLSAFRSDGLRSSSAALRHCPLFR
jgi:phospholipid/cholesterol/gamma-HCH transport system permease protein